MAPSRTSRIVFTAGIMLVAILSSVANLSASTVELSEGQTVYVPVYSHIYVGFKRLSFDLAVSLSIRNTDMLRPITILSVSYFNSEGKRVREHLKGPIQVGPLAAVDFFVSEQDTTGGFGAAFIVKWKSSTKVNEPIIESVMTGTKSGQGISFTTRGQAINNQEQ